MLYYANISKPMVVGIVLMNSLPVSKKITSQLEILVGWCHVGSSSWVVSCWKFQLGGVVLEVPVGCCGKQATQALYV
jgi:hypothetical protein